MKVRQLNMAIDRKSYIVECRNTSKVLVEHVIKLYLFKSPEDIRGWLISVRKGLEVETKTINSRLSKPTIEHLYSILGAGTEIDDTNLRDIVRELRNNPKYNSLDTNPNYDLYELEDMLYDLVDRLDTRKKYNQSELITLIESWWNKYKWY